MATAGVMTWSKTAASNATADPTVNWAEGQAPSSVNDSARAEMASVAKWRDDISGTLTTAGTATAYTLTTNATFATAAAMSGAMITFIPSVTSGASPTLAVDGLTARAINFSTGVAVPSGFLVVGTPYTVTYVHASTEFILHNAFTGGFSTGDVKMTIKLVADPGWVLCTDGSIGDAASSATTRANADCLALFTLLYDNFVDADLPIATSAGAATTRAAQTNAATAWAAHCKITLLRTVGRAFGMAGSGSGLTSRVMGSTIGAETVTIATTNVPALTVTVTDPGHTHNTETVGAASLSGGAINTPQDGGGAAGGIVVSNTTGITAAANVGSPNTPLGIVQPTAWFNVMIKL